MLKHFDVDTNDDPIPSWTITNEFDSKGRIIKIVDTDQEKITTNEYDNYDCVIKWIEIDIEDKNVYTSTYYKNNPVKPLHVFHEEYAINGNEDEPVSTDTTDYEYDTHDRIKKITLNEDNDITTTEYFYELE